MFQLLPRFELIKLAGFNINEIDYFVVNGLQSKFQIETLQILGLGPERLIQSSNVPYLQARRLIVRRFRLLTAVIVPGWFSF